MMPERKEETDTGIVNLLCEECGRITPHILEERGRTKKVAICVLCEEEVGILGTETEE